MSGIRRQIDRLGRIVIPKSYRKALSINENSDLNVTIDHNSIVITKPKQNCMICGTSSRLHPDISLCDECIKKIKELP